MKREISPQDSSRAEAFRLWMSSPMPMVTLVKTLDVTRLVRVRKRSGMKFTTLMCWCIGKAASQIEEFYTLPENGKLHVFSDCVTSYDLKKLPEMLAYYAKQGCELITIQQ